MADRDPLDEFLDAARTARPVPPQALMARIVDDAEREAPRPEARDRVPFWRGLVEGLGGWPALAGLATATVAGVWIGAADPLELDPLSLLGASSLEAADLSTGYADLDWGEG